MRDGVLRFKDDLRRAGRECPQLFIQKLEDIGLTELEIRIMKLRYCDGLLIKQISDLVSVGDRWVKKVHSKAIIRALDKLNALDLVELGIPIRTTTKTLYDP